MKKFFNKILSSFEKVPILSYILLSIIKSFIFFGILLLIIYFTLSLTGIYSKLETALDLKYNSPVVIIPIFIFSLLCVICIVVGFLLYFHKYKRSISKTPFYNSVVSALKQK